MDGRGRIENYLKNNNVPHQFHHHPSVAFTAQEVAQLEEIPGRMVAKVVMTFVDRKLTMFVLPAPYWLDLKKAGEELGAMDVRLATEDEFVDHFPDCERGAIPALGNVYGIPVYVDRALSQDRTIFFQGETHNDVIEVEFKDFVRVADATMVEVARNEAA